MIFRMRMVESSQAMAREAEAEEAEREKMGGRVGRVDCRTREDQHKGKRKKDENAL